MPSTPGPTSSSMGSISPLGPARILGVAGVDGNGQQELEEALMGLLPIRRGRILLNGTDITSLNTAQRRQRGIAHIPSDRLRRGLIPASPLRKISS